MVYQFADVELRDAREQVNAGRYYAAAQFVANAQADIELAPFEFGSWMDEFVNYSTAFQTAAEKPNPRVTHLEYLLDSLESIMDEMIQIRAREDEDYEPST